MHITIYICVGEETHMPKMTAHMKVGGKLSVVDAFLFMVLGMEYRSFI